MAFTLFDDLSMRLSHEMTVRDVTLPGDGTVRANCRTGIFEVPVTAEFLGVLTSAGLSLPMSTVGSRIMIGLIIGFPISSEREWNGGYVDARVLNQDMLTSSGDIKISVAIQSLWKMCETAQGVVLADPNNVFNVAIRVPWHSKHIFNFSTDGTGRDWEPTLWTQDTLGGYRTGPFGPGVDRWAVTCSAKFTYEIPDSSQSDDLAFNRRMLTEELCCDVVVIAANKKEVKFHRCFMTAQSSVFNAMFQSGMAEARSGVVEMPDMTEEGVRVLREYLYLGKLEGPIENAEVCCELFEAAHKYDIQKLEKIMEKVFLQKPHDWYSVDVALRLFLFARAIGEEGLQMKTKAACVLKARHEEFKALSSYRNLFEENPDVAMDLYECLAQL